MSAIHAAACECSRCCHSYSDPAQACDHPTIGGGTLAALEDFKRGEDEDGPCFCDPTGRGAHSARCDEARAALVLAGVKS